MQPQARATREAAAGPGTPAGALQDTPPARPLRKGQVTRRAVLRVAVDIASAEGLEGLTIGRLARELGMSKSGLFAHFGSKVELQLATVQEAGAVFLEEVIRPALAAPPGMARLWTLYNAWLSHVERRVFRGGCFFAAAGAEFDSRPGPVRDLLVALSRQWLDGLADAARDAQRRGELDTVADPEQLAFEMNGCLLSTNWARELLGDEGAFTRARAAMRDRLLRLSASPAGREALSLSLELPERSGRILPVRTEP